jgi:hypothetical protein
LTNLVRGDKINIELDTYSPVPEEAGVATKYFIHPELVRAVQVLSAHLENEVEILTELGLDLAGVDRHLVNMVVIDHVSAAAAHLAEEPEDATKSRLEYIIAEGEKVLLQAKGLEWSYLVSGRPEAELHRRFERLESPDLRVRNSYDHWFSLSKRGTTAGVGDLRKAYLAASTAVDEALEREADERIKRAMAPPPAPSRKPKHRRSAEDSELRSKMRGTNPQPPKHGGGGNSRDARRRARKRQVA